MVLAKLVILVKSSSKSTFCCVFFENLDKEAVKFEIWYVHRKIYSHLFKLIDMDKTSYLGTRTGVVLENIWILYQNTEIHFQHGGGGICPFSSAGK